MSNTSEPLPRRAFLGAIPVGAAVLLAAACAKEDDAGAKADGDKPAAPGTTFDIPVDEMADETDSATVTIVVVDNSFEPRYVEITAGTKVVWRNDGRNTHNIVPSPEDLFVGIDDDKFVPGASHIVIFPDAGDFPYFCSIHGTMKNGQNGAIRVVPKK